jgi:hypothetical protein
MKFDWQQLSPREREALLRHFLLKRKMDGPVTAEKVCAALHKTHYLSCYAKADGKAVFRFVTTAKGVRSGMSMSDELTDGIYKAALRAKGVDVEDGFGVAFGARSRPVRIGRSVIH